MVSDEEAKKYKRNLNFFVSGLALCFAAGTYSALQTAEKDAQAYIEKAKTEKHQLFVEQKKGYFEITEKQGGNMGWTDKFVALDRNLVDMTVMRNAGKEAYIFSKNEKTGKGILEHFVKTHYGMTLQPYQQMDNAIERTDSLSVKTPK